MPNSAVNETVKKMKESSKAKNADNADANTENDDADENIDPDENANSDENIDTNESSDENINPDTNDSAEKNESTNESGQYYDLTGNDLDMNYVIVAMIAEDPKSFEGVRDHRHIRHGPLHRHQRPPSLLPTRPSIYIKR